MLFVSAFCFFLAIYFGVAGFRDDDSGFKGMALAFLMAGIGTALISAFAFSVIE
jgi:hypothetical protein